MHHLTYHEILQFFPVYLDLLYFFFFRQFVFHQLHCELFCQEKFYYNRSVFYCKAVFSIFVSASLGRCFSILSEYW